MFLVEVLYFSMGLVRNANVLAILFNFSSRSFTKIISSYSLFQLTMTKEGNNTIHKQKDLQNVLFLTDIYANANGLKPMLEQYDDKNTQQISYGSYTHAYHSSFVFVFAELGYINDPLRLHLIACKIHVPLHMMICLKN